MEDVLYNGNMNGSAIGASSDIQVVSSTLTPRVRRKATAICGACKSEVLCVELQQHLQGCQRFHCYVCDKSVAMETPRGLTASRNDHFMTHIAVFEERGVLDFTGVNGPGCFCLRCV